MSNAQRKVLLENLRRNERSNELDSSVLEPSNCLLDWDSHFVRH